MWSPDQYEKFKSERSQPFRDLVALIEPQPQMRVVDLGCGTGELTLELHEHLHARETIGIDNSEAMLAKAPSAPGLRFELRRIEEFSSEQGFDLVFSNAALHWVANHDALFRRLTGFAGGQIAVQMPANDDHPSHAIAAEVALELGIEPKAVHTLPPERYAQLLYDLGYKRQDVRLKIYGHVLPSSADVVEWVKGTLLTFYQHPQFVDRYRRRLMAALGDQRPYFYTYKRLLIWASLLGEDGVHRHHHSG